MKKTTKKAKRIFSKEEVEAMKEAIKERSGTGQGEEAVLEKIAKLPEPDRSMAKRVHAIIMKNFPNLTTKTWYGFPAYVKDDSLVCFFQYASKFKARYSTLSFSDKAKLDEGNMWPVVYAITKLTAAEESKIIALVKKALR